MKMKKKRKSQREGGCVQRMEVIFFWGGGVSGLGGGLRVDVNGEVSEAFVKIQKKKNWGGGVGGSGQGGGQVGGGSGV